MNPDSLEVDYSALVAAITTTIASNGNLGYDPMYGTITASSVPTYKEHAIKGEMLIATSSFDEAEVQAVGKDKIREDLAMQIAEALLTNKCIDFTQMRDHFSGKLVVKARVYVVPDTQVRILRTSGV